MQLNAEQTAAVEHPIGEPACLIAGAGSGKTRVLTERVRWLINQGVPPKRIVIVTFTNKAANSLIERLGIDPSAPRDLVPRASTIHSLALSAIRRNPLGFGLQTRVSPLDEGDAASMIKKIIDRKGIEDQNQWAVLEAISYHRTRGLCFSSEYTEDVNQQMKKIHSGYHVMDPDRLAIWRAFEEDKKACSVVDFDDMIHLCVHRGRTDSVWREKLGKTFLHVLQDECQDTNPVAWEFLNMLLAPDNQNMYCVGDMNQAIYSFIGSTPELLKQYSEGWRGIVPKLYKIQRNHRSVPEIVNLANAVCAKMTNTIPLHMESWRGGLGDHGTTKLMRACEPRDVAIQIAAEISHDAQLKKNPIAYKDNAILVRSGKTQVRDIEAELVKRRIPYVVRGGLSLLQTEEVRDLMSYMRLVANPNDFMALGRAVGVPKRGVGPQSLEKIRDKAKTMYNNDLIAACSEEKKLQGFAMLIKRLEEHKKDPYKALQEIIRLIDYTQIIRDKYRREPERAAQKLENIDRLHLMLQVLLEDMEMTIEDLVFQLSIDKQTEDTRDDGKVVISTIHSAKGLEFQRVYVTNCYEGSLPHKFSMGSPEEICEERRLFYVAVTRAKDSLVICVPAMVQYGPNTNSLAPSRFLSELKLI